MSTGADVGLAQVGHSGEAGQQVGYSPTYTSPQAIADGVAWPAEHGHVDLGPDAARI